MSDKIEKALELINKIADKHETDCEHWVTKDGCEFGDFEVYCGDCIKNAVKKHRKEYLLDQRKKIRKERDKPLHSFDWTYSQCLIENNNFEHCANCGKSISVSLLLDDQELDHWLEDCVTISKDTHDCYELQKILEKYDESGSGKYLPKLIMIAEKVIKAWDTPKEES